MDPTTEQQEAVDLFAGGDNLAIEAGAGTGKTTTLQLIAASTSGIGSYIAFNKAIVNEAGRKMPDTVASSTAHSLAFRAIGKQYAHRINTGRVRSWDIARQLGVHPITVTYGQQRKTLAADYLAGLVMRTLRAFAQSADREPQPRHVPYVDGIDVPDANGQRTWSNNDEVRRYLAPLLIVAWRDIGNPEGSLPFTHDHYLKLWQLSGPRIASEFILFDEAQDASPVMLDIVTRQSAQLVFVGDSQQQIYEWRGAINALDQVTADQRTFLTQSFRFGPPIAEVANACLERLHADLRITGAATHTSTTGPAPAHDAILTRTNACAVSSVLQAQRRGIKVYLVGGGGEIASFARAAQDLMDGTGTRHPELACFRTWGEVQDYVSQDPQGDELSLMVHLVDEYGVDVILGALDGMGPNSEARAQLLVSTAHKAKGREWRRVQLAGDFPDEGLIAADWRLAYVAATRAQEHLDYEHCWALRRAMRPNEKLALEGEEVTAS